MRCTVAATARVLAIPSVCLPLPLLGRHSIGVVACRNIICGVADIAFLSFRCPRQLRIKAANRMIPLPSSDQMSSLKVTPSVALGRWRWLLPPFARATESELQVTI